jgi:outer membrane protein assembly factor BamD (BamD/ComL family)
VQARPGNADAAPSAKAPSPATRLREEATLIKDARQALRQGNAARALKVLAEHRRVFPAGVLEQERERLIIEALLKDGRAADASARAAVFLRKYPDSPHASEVRGLGLAASGNR